uniref:Peptidase S1 domain-containing protein n=1 Tax=Globodera rostochiensis TaxID=31243 RepID=A0A914HKD2_GLORO
MFRKSSFLSPILLFLTILPTFSQSSNRDDAEAPCGVPPLNKNFTRFDYLMPDTHRLVGSLESSPHAWPWTGQLVAMRMEANGSATVTHKCGCALIARDFVVTAAHCFAKSRLPSRFIVLLGGHQIFDGKVQFKTFLIIHPLYQIVHSAYDAALLRISPVPKFDDFIWPICLPTRPAAVNGMCVVTGWGRLAEGGKRPTKLREIHVPVMRTTTCNSVQHYAGRLHYPSMICAGFNAGKSDACQGDSGGPLQCQNAKNVWELQGIVSWGIGCANPKFPGVYTKMFVICPWIRTEMRRLKTLYPLALKEQKSE